MNLLINKGNIILTILIISSVLFTKTILSSAIKTFKKDENQSQFQNPIAFRLSNS